MQSRTSIILRRAVLVLLAIAAAWLALFASGYGKFVRREDNHVGTAQGLTVTCRYVYALGTFDTVDFTTDPDAVSCPDFASSRSTPATSTRWAAPIPTNRTVQLECRFIRYPADGDSGLGERFTAEAPLRITLNFGTGEFALDNAEDQAMLGRPTTDFAQNRTTTTIQFDQGGSLLIFAGEPRGRLTLSIFSGDGTAGLFLVSTQQSLLSSRQGGCRPIA